MSFYSYITSKRSDSSELKQKMQDTVSQLIQKSTDSENPGMLLGLIQSGKTRAFIGIMALGFDEMYDICVVLTKSSKALVAQTVKRIKSEFQDPVENDAMYVYDIMNMPPLTEYIINKKNVFVVKKEDDNLTKLNEVFFEQYPSLGNKKVLIIDDEADSASITYYRDNNAIDGLRIGVLAELISSFRSRLSNASDFLQVTATPYSLYLQPESIEVNAEGYAPLKPAFTVVLEPHEAYIGGKVYFEESEDSSSYASHIYQAIDPSEFDRLRITKNRRRPDSRLTDNILNTDLLAGFRNAFINYITAGAIRSIQEHYLAVNSTTTWKKEYKSAFLIHVHTGKQSHNWQYIIINSLIDKLGELGIDDFKKIVIESLNGFKDSIEKASKSLPDTNEIVDRVHQAIHNGEISVKEVNSESSVIDLLDENGQLRLDNPFNIFIGGQVLDRGITIENLISFYYGRSPGRFQMDTVLQHSRMYGARKIEDMAVTRLYTSQRIFLAMRDMHFFDDALRQACLNQERVKFIQKRQNGSVIPCSPNKVANSIVQTIRRYSRHLPKGFQTVAPSKLKSITQKIDTWINEKEIQNHESVLLDISDVIPILKLIRSSYVFDDRFNNKELDWDLDTFVDILKYTSSHDNQVNVFTRDNRNASRYKSNGNAFTDAPDDGRLDLRPARRMAIDKPVLMLLRQNGNINNGWRSEAFYWPVLLAPSNMQTCIYTEEN